MKVCDRCRQGIKKERTTVIAGKKLELCEDCSKIILDSIKNYKSKPGFLDFKI